MFVSYVAAPFTCVFLFVGSTGEKPLYLSIHVLWLHSRGIGYLSAPQFRYASQELRLQNSVEEVPVKMCIPEIPEASICFTGFASATCLGGVKWFEKCPKGQEIQRYTENSLGAPQSKSDLQSKSFEYSRANDSYFEMRLTGMCLGASTICRTLQMLSSSQVLHVSLLLPGNELIASEWLLGWIITISEAQLGNKIASIIF